MPPRRDDDDDKRDDANSTPSRACDACRKMKIRCIDKENPPCKRCRAMKLECRFELSGAPRLAPEEIESFTRDTKTRLDSLEGQVGGISDKLDDISSVLKLLAQKPGAAEPRPDVPLFGPSPGQPSASPSMWLDRKSSRPFTHPSHSPHSSIITQAPPAPAYDDGEDDDPIESAMYEPFRDLTRKEEEQRLRAEGLEAPTSGTWATLAAEVGHRDKRRKRSRDDEHAEPAPQWAIPPVHQHGGVFYTADPVTLGWCSEAEGKELFNAFFEYAHPFIPVFDPREDTWEGLRRRSPLCITIILLVSLRARDGCGEPSELTTKCREQAENLAKYTLFSPVATLETVQGLSGSSQIKLIAVLLTSWTEHGWRICCHTMSLAVDMRLYRCLPYIHKTRKEWNKPSERQRSLVVGARLWLAVVKQGYEMAYNHALPVQFSSFVYQERNQYARELLEHPLSTIWDSRLIVSVELLEVRESAYRPYQVAATLSQVDEDALLRVVSRGINEHYDYWLDYYHRLDLKDDHYLIKELKSQKAYANLFSFSGAWSGVKSREDVARLSRERRQWVGAGVRAGAFLISSIGSGPQEKHSEYANHNFHVAIVATARYLIRMVELLPEVCDLYQVSLDIDKLLLKLPHYPAHPFTDVLRRAVTRAREQGVLPVTTISEDADPLDQLLTGFNPLPWNVEPPQAQASATPEFDPRFQAFPEDFNIIASWFAGIDGLVVPQESGMGAAWMAE